MTIKMFTRIKMIVTNNIKHILIINMMILKIMMIYYENGNTLK